MWLVVCAFWAVALLAISSYVGWVKKIKSRRGRCGLTSLCFLVYDASFTNIGVCVGLRNESGLWEHRYDWVISVSASEIEDRARRKSSGKAEEGLMCRGLYAHWVPSKNWNLDIKEQRNVHWINITREALFVSEFAPPPASPWRVI
jgi:hypothetical protein